MPLSNSTTPTPRLLLLSAKGKYRALSLPPATPSEHSSAADSDRFNLAPDPDQAVSAPKSETPADNDTSTEIQLPLKTGFNEMCCDSLSANHCARSKRGRSCGKKTPHVSHEVRSMLKSLTNGIVTHGA